MLKKSLTVFIFIFLYLQADLKAQREDNYLGFRLPAGKSKYTLPFEVINNLIIVRVVLNNTLPLKFILDTGVRTAILTEKTFSDLLNISYSRKITIPGAGGEKLVDAYIAPNVTLDIEGVVGHGHALLVLERDLLQLKNFLGNNVQGILGFEIFSRFIVDINYQKKTMTLYEPQEFAKHRFDRKKKFHAIPITVEDTKPYCYSNIVYYSGKKFRAKFMLDTGASHALLLDTNSNEEVQIPNVYIDSHLGRGLAGDVNGKIARLQKLDMNGFQFEDIITTFPDKAFYLQGYDKIYRNGTLGGGVLSRFRVIFDFINGYVYLKKNKQFKAPFNYNMSGVIIQAKGLYLKSFEIIQVRKNSTAEKADILPGDLILGINNHDTKDLELNEINGLFNSKPNRTIRLELSRNGKLIRRQFQLEKII
jgi:hypothetical protein